MLNIHVMVMSCSCHIHCAQGFPTGDIYSRGDLDLKVQCDTCASRRIEAPDQTRGVEATNDTNSNIFERVHIEVS